LVKTGIAVGGKRTKFTAFVASTRLRAAGMIGSSEQRVPRGVTASVVVVTGLKEALAARIYGSRQAFQR